MFIGRVLYRPNISTHKKYCIFGRKQEEMAMRCTRNKQFIAFTFQEFSNLRATISCKHIILEELVEKKV